MSISVEYSKDALEKISNIENENRDQVYILFMNICRAKDKELVIEFYNKIKDFNDFSINMFDDLAFKLIKEDPELVNIFIYDFKIEKTETIKALFKKNTYLEKLFNIRDLKSNLNESLNSDNKKSSVKKI